jgi:hypothetical protein
MVEFVGQAFVGFSHLNSMIFWFDQFSEMSGILKSGYGICEF